ncbi:MAG: hypothetical protein IPJ41_03880 [Phycisphaerales bacterium]|nr:hypothetical protein [Phycisphaerales bacterium]
MKGRKFRIVRALSAGLAVFTLAGASCAPERRAPDTIFVPSPLAPAHVGLPGTESDGQVGTPPGIAAAAITDTRTHARIDPGPWKGRIRNIEDLLGDEELEEHSPRLRREPKNNLPVGGTLDAVLARPGPLFPGIGQTEWVPPDPTIAVGPNHVVATVNMKIAFWDKAGNLQYLNWLSDSGDPGFFEPVGGSWFTFDPKCFYDQIAGRFVVVAPETYGSDQAWICIAVSDDSDPNGVWYLYRTDAVIWDGAQSFWWDYPGFGYDKDAYYVTGNLFGLNQGGWGGVGVRVFKKQPLLSGQPAQFWTLRDGGSSSAQVAQHFGANQAPFFVSLASSNKLRVHAIKNPITNPQLVSADVAIPSFRGPTGAPASGGNSVSLVDGRLFNAQWRDGELYTAHTVSHFDGRNFARWYHLRTNSWPAAGVPTLVESGEVDAGPDIHTYFPAIYSNAQGQVGLVHGMSSASTRIAVAVTGRNATDPPGAMGMPHALKLAPVDSGGRWGDYYDIALDPADGRTFWAVGEYPESWGWSTWIQSFTIDQTPGPVAVWDDAGDALTGTPLTIDVTANDYHTGGQPFDVWYFEPTTAAGGRISRVQGGGSGGRSALRYEAPAGYEGPDSFTYTLTDNAQHTSSAQVVVAAHDPARFLAAEPAPGALSGVDGDYFALSQPQALPDFTQLTPYSSAVADAVDFPASDGPFADSGRADEVGAVFEGYLDVPRDAVYELSVESDDGSRLLIGGQTVADNDGLHSMQEQSGKIGLRAGLHTARVEFFESGGSAGLVVRIAGGGLARQIVPAAMWRRTNPCPSDSNGDGMVNTADFVQFLNAWVGKRPWADYTGDGQVNTPDFIAFLNSWVAGCP